VVVLPTFYANMTAQSAAQPGFRSAAYDVMKGVEDLRRQNMEGLILDLRNDGGGSLLEAIRLVGLFISSGPVVQVKERDSIRILPDRDPAVLFAGPMVVLVNRLSASASEIVAAALQDYGRAVIVGGQKTHGKGTVQTVLSVGRDEKMGTMKITTASYYRINGMSAQQKGVASDIVLPSPFDHMDLGEDALPHALPWSTVMPARFLPVADLDFIIPTLAEKSAKRVAADPRFVAFSKLIQGIDRINQTQELPLDLASRRQMARTEKELADMQRQLMPFDEENPNVRDNRSADLILDEGLKILADLITLQQRQTPLVYHDEAAAHMPLIQVIEDWLKNTL
jgi:carboxyl-terminal processing protease